MTCSYCHQEFTKEEAEGGCEGCGAFGGCHLVKCPHCDYYQPQEPGWVKKVRELFRKKHLETRSADERPR